MRYETKIETSCRARRGAMWMWKEYREAIIGGIGGGIGCTILWYILRGEFAWPTLIIYPISYFFAHLWFDKRLEAMKEEDVQQRE